MATPDFIKAPIALVTNLLLPHPVAQKVDMSGKQVLVTGASLGSIGYESAKQLLQFGADVCVTARSEKSLTEILEALRQELNIGAEDKRLRGKTLDLAEVQSVQNFAQWFKSEFSRLDVLLNNAGIYFDVMGKWTEEKLSDDQEEIHWRVNFLGTMHLSFELMDLLLATSEKDADVRIVNVSSHMHDNCNNEEMFTGLKPYKSVKAYGRSKLGINHMSFFLHDALHGPKGIKIFCLHPGSVYTNLAHKGLEGQPLMQIMRSRFSMIERLILLNPYQGAQTQVHCASADVEGGVYFRRCKAHEYSPELKDKQAQRQVFETLQGWFKKHQLDFSSLDQYWSKS